MEKPTLEEAARLFPVGTKFNNTNLLSWETMDKVVCSKPEYSNHTSGDIVVDTESSARYTIYREGKWAKNLSNPMDSYPIF